VSVSLCVCVQRSSSRTESDADADVRMTFIPRYLEGQSAVTIQRVSCGDFFTACLTGLCLLVRLSVCLLCMFVCMCVCLWQSVWLSLSLCLSLCMSKAVFNKWPLFLLLARYVPNENTVILRTNRPTDQPTDLSTDRLNDLAFWKISNGHISASGHPIHFMFGSRVRFSRSADRMALFPVGPNSRWRLAAILDV